METKYKISKYGKVTCKGRKVDLQTEKKVLNNYYGLDRCHMIRDLVKDELNLNR